MKRRRARKYKPISFKFTTQQKRRVDAFCKKNNTSAIRMYKKAIMLYLTNNGYPERYEPEPEVIANQMSIFDLITED